MKFRKSTMSILLIITLFMSIISSSYTFAADAFDYSGAVLRMKQLGILDSSISDATKVMTRGEFAKAVVIADNLIDTASGMEGATIFGDITAYSNLSGYINILLSKQLISGMADGKFHPEAGITYSEVCTIFVKLLGYTDSDLKGTWPSNYLSKVSSLKITDNLVFKKSDKITLRAAAVMFDRLLSTNVKSDSTNDTNKVIFSDSKKLYSDYIIQDNSESYGNLAENEVLTDKGVLTIPGNNSLLQVGATYRLKVDDTEIKEVYGKAKETQTITVKTIVGNIVYYMEDGKEKSMTLPSSISYYYHGVKKDYVSASSLLLINMSIVFNYNNETSYSYAVITDAIYSKPELASEFNPQSDKLGEITFDSNTVLIKNGQSITKKQIKDTDVVYSVTDISGNNRYILVIENYIEGNITDFLADADSLNGIKIDAVSYNYSNDMDITKLASYVKGNLVSIILDKDGKALDIKGIEHKTGNVAAYIILGNSKTSDNLADNEVLTDKGKFTYMEGVESLEIGVKYQLYVSDNVVTKIDKKENFTENYVVTEKTGLDMKWKNDNNEVNDMKLPKATVYYYHGEKVNYNAAMAAIDAFSSIILSRSSNKNEYEYAVIINPHFSEPKVYKRGDTELWNEIQNSKYSYVYKDEMYTMNPYNISSYNVVYFVSDIWNKNCYIYVTNKIVYGVIEAFTPSKTNASSIKINNQVYELSQYLDRTKLNGSYTGYSIKLIIGVDGKVVDIY
jgi:hypothetical protein